jgi:hypothetical protein
LSIFTGAAVVLGGIARRHGGGSSTPAGNAING